MTDGPAPDEKRLRSVSRRLRREKLRLERVNPVEQPERYVAALTAVVDLEAERRDLRAALGRSGGEGEEEGDEEGDEDRDGDG